MAKARKVWWPYEQASAWVKAQGIRSHKAWVKYRQEHDVPEGMPGNPYRTYADVWTSWGDFLQTGTVFSRALTFRSYEDASAWAKAQGITSWNDWRARRKRPDFPADIPSTPQRQYQKVWTTWGDFLGTGFVSTRVRTYRSFESARQWAREQGIFTLGAWRARTRQADFPSDLPVELGKVYHQEWKGFEDFIGLSSTSTSKVERALKFGLQQVLDLDPSRMPGIHDGGRVMHVDMVDRKRRIVVEYDGSYWHKSPRKRADDLAKTHRLQQAGWQVIRVREAPLDLLDPRMDVQVSVPLAFYVPLIVRVVQHLETLVLNQVLGDDGLLERIRASLLAPVHEADLYAIMIKGWRSYDEASDWAQSENIRSQGAWYARSKLEGFPEDIPKVPSITYRSAWKGWRDFLQTARKRD